MKTFSVVCFLVLLYLLLQSPLAGYKRAGDLQYSSLPRQVGLSTTTPALDTPRKGVAFGRSLVFLRAAGDRSSSVPNLGDRRTHACALSARLSPSSSETETIVITDSVSDMDGRSYTPQPSPSPSLQTNKSRGIKKIFNKSMELVKATTVGGTNNCHSKLVYGNGCQKFFRT
ncbi:hypothetical protein J6590_061420 [Homalodisca vitripennis]|nr:hypothetical protein J6590_098099 [Homalodisca vitripennis]KAG8310588.1 hypothetical protein J6590_061420 [Homalodisca vitripennis]